MLKGNALGVQNVHIGTKSRLILEAEQLFNRTHRHEKPVENDLSHQNMQDRYYGRNDPVARKIMATHADSQGLTPPDDQSIVCALCPF